MNKVQVNMSEQLGENTYKVVLKNGLEVYICKKVGFEKKIGMFGTKYGSIINNFVDITKNERIQVPDGIAHFLEHKLFEQEGANALDLFSKIGVSSNAYTTFDHTVYFFETIDKFDEAIKLLIKLVKTPYFTDENVNKEQGIIGQEIMMYDDDPSFAVYFNALRAMYNTHPVRIDIAGTIESISHITKELLYTCYNTFYSPQNMFIIVVGDVDVDNTIKLIEESIRVYEKDYDMALPKPKIKKFIKQDEPSINEKEIIQKMPVYMPKLCMGYKLDVVEKEEIIKRQVLCDIISDLYFSKITSFFENEYNLGVLSEPVNFDFEGTSSFSHVIISAESTKIDILKKDILDYINKIKKEDIDLEMFEVIKKKKIGNIIKSSDNLNVSYRRIIESLLEEVDIYSDVKILENITPKDIKDFLQLLDEDKLVFSIIN